MAIIIPTSKNLEVGVPSGLAALAGVTVAAGYTYALLPAGTYFAGRVLRTYRETVQVMSDVWEDYTFVEVVTDDLEVYTVRAPYIEAYPDIHPALEAAYKSYTSFVRSASASLGGAEMAVKDATPKLRRGCKAIVHKGRKIEVGTEVQVFWVGSKRNPYSRRMEERAGVLLPSGEKVFCDAGNLEVVPTQDELDAYVAAKARLALAKHDHEGALASKAVIMEQAQACINPPAAVPVEEPAISAETEAAIRAAVPAAIMVREMLRAEEGNDVADQWYESTWN